MSSTVVIPPADLFPTTGTGDAVLATSPTFLGAVKFADGTAAAPSISFAADSALGFSRAASGIVRFSSAGLATWYFARSSVNAQFYNPTGGGGISTNDSGAVAVTAGSAVANQNITLTPSGTGFVACSSAVQSAGFYTNVANSTGLIGNGNNLLLNITAVASTYLRIQDANSNIIAQFQQNGRTLLGTTTDSGALLQVGTDLTTAANGMIFGTDTRLYRSAVNGLIFNGTGTGDTGFNIAKSGTIGLGLLYDGANAYLTATAGMLLRTNGGNTALTLDLSQGATFAKRVAAQDYVIGALTTGASVSSAVNTRAPRSGLAFDGTSGARVFSALTGQNVGTDSFSVSVFVDIPTSNPTVDRGVWYVGPASGQANVARTIYMEFKTAGELAISILGATTSDVRTATWNGFRAAYSGKRIHLLIVRDSTTSTIALYVNGIALTPNFNGVVSGSDPTWAGLVTSNFFQLGNNAAGAQVWDRCIYSASLYNLALSQADVTEIMELGGAVPERYKFGSQAFSGRGAFINNGNYTGFGSATAAGFTAAYSAYPADGNGPINRAVVRGNVFRVRGTLTLNSGTLSVAEARFFTSVENTQLGSIALTGGNFDFTLATSGSSPTGSNNGVSVRIGSLGAANITVSSVVVDQLGAVVHLPLNDNAGLIAYDSSTNALNATITATGVTWVLPPSKVVQVVDGTAAAPSISFAADSDTGVYRVASGYTAISSNGSAAFSFGFNGADARMNGIAGSVIDFKSTGAINLIAGSGNNNITLTPSGTGFVALGTSLLKGAVFASTYVSLTSFVVLAANDHIVFAVNGAAECARFHQTGRLGLGTGATDSGALLQIGTNTTTSAGGIVFGTDTFLYRHGSGGVTLSCPTGSVSQQWNANVGIVGYVTNSGSDFVFSAQQGNLVLKSNNTTALTLDASQNATFAASVNVLNTAAIRWTSWTQMLSPLDGVIRFCNAAGTDFNRLQFGGTTASFPAIKRSGTEIHARFADDSAFAPFMASAFYSNNGDYFLDSTGTAKLRRAAGTPEGNVTAPVGSLYLRSDGGASTTLYIKESGTGNTGWVAK